MPNCVQISSRRRSTASASAPPSSVSVTSGTSSTKEMRRDGERRAGERVDLVRQRDLDNAAPRSFAAWPSQNQRNGGASRSGVKSIARRAKRSRTPGPSSPARSASSRAGRGVVRRRAGVVVRVRRRLEQPARAALEVAEVEPALLGALERSAARARPRPRRPRRWPRPPAPSRRGSSAPSAMRRSGRNALDPDARSPASPTLVAAKRLERVDLVGARVLAEAEEDHRAAVGHRADYRLQHGARTSRRRTAGRLRRVARGTAAPGARAAVLRDGKHSLAEAVALAHVRLKVDRRHVGGRRDAALPMRRMTSSRSTPAEASHVHEPRAHVIGVIGGRRLDVDAASSSRTASRRAAGSQSRRAARPPMPSAADMSSRR